MAAVEVPPALGPPSGDVEQRVVIRGVDLGRDPLLDPAQDVAEHSIDVRGAADRVLVLDVPVVLDEIRTVHLPGDDLVAVHGQLRVRQQFSNSAGALHHPRVRLGGVEQEGVEVAAVPE